MAQVNGPLSPTPLLLRVRKLELNGDPQRGVSPVTPQPRPGYQAVAQWVQAVSSMPNPPISGICTGEWRQLLVELATRDLWTVERSRSREGEHRSFSVPILLAQPGMTPPQRLAAERAARRVAGRSGARTLESVARRESWRATQRIRRYVRTNPYNPRELALVPLILQDGTALTWGSASPGTLALKASQLVKGAAPALLGSALAQEVAHDVRIAGQPDLDGLAALP